MGSIKCGTWSPDLAEADAGLELAFSFGSPNDASFSFGSPSAFTRPADCAGFKFDALGCLRGAGRAELVPAARGATTAGATFSTGMKESGACGASAPGLRALS